jgi:molybdopterin adenylyltransferase
MKVARLTLSDRASSGVYADRSGPEIERVWSELHSDAVDWIRGVIPDDQESIAAALRQYCDVDRLTTGGTGPAARDVTPEATRSVIERELPGFGEVMRMQSFEKVKTSILSRATAGTRNGTLIVNMPGNPRAISECLPLVYPAIVEAVRHLHGD